MPTDKGSDPKQTYVKGGAAMTQHPPFFTELRPTRKTLQPPPGPAE